jgi:hypothetical protein
MDTQPEPPLDLDELLKVTPSTTRWLRQRVRDLREYQELRTRLTSKQLAEDLRNAVTEANIDGFMAGRHVFSVAAHEALVRHLWLNKWCGNTWLKEGIAAHPAALFHALSAFLVVGEQSIINLRHEITGTYRLWRPSMHFPGKHVLGKMVFDNEFETGSVQAVETQIYKGDEHTAGQAEIFEGYLIKKSRYFLVIARQSEIHKGPPRTTLFHNAIYSNGIVRALEGVVIGCYGSNNLFAAPIYLERVDEKDLVGLDDQLDIKNEIPPLVAAKLTFNLNDNLIRF